MKTLIYVLLFATCFVACSKETESEGTIIDYSSEDKTQKTSSEDSNPTGRESSAYMRRFPADNFIQVYVEPTVMHGDQDTEYDEQCDRLLPSMAMEIAGIGYAPSSYGVSEYSIRIGATQFVYDYEVDPVLPVGYIPKDDESVVLPVDRDEMRATMKENVRKFYELAKLLGDTCFKGELSPLSHHVIKDSIFAIDVICNDDFDENHKKGDSVNDIITFYGSTPYHYVTNGYNWLCKYPLSAVPDGLFGKIYRDFIICKVDDIAEQETKYCCNFFSLYFDKLPEKTGTYTFDVIVKFTEKELKTTVTMKF